MPSEVTSEMTKSNGTVSASSHAEASGRKARRSRAMPSRLEPSIVTKSPGMPAAKAIVISGSQMCPPHCSQ